MALSKPFLLLAAVLQAQPEPQDHRFDLRGDEPFSPLLKFTTGPDMRNHSKREAEGLRITLPADRKSTQPVGLRLKGRVSGDFEITGTFELLSDERPKQGLGAGVALNIATDDSANKFAKVGRFTRPEDGRVFLAEHWHRSPPKTSWVKPIPTEARAGRVRLTRKGSILQYLVAHGLDGEFQQITEHDFGDEDIDLVRFIVNTNNSPIGIDARLIELRVRTGTVVPDHIAAPPGPSSPFGRAAALWGFIAALVILLVGGVSYLVTRRKKKTAEAPTGPVKKPGANPASVERRT